MSQDPLKKLKYIAYCRSQLPPEELDKTAPVVVDYARWQICKIRNILFNDPIWDRYTSEEILIEYFTIRFDESDEDRQAFLGQLKGVKQDDLEWFEEMKNKAEKERLDKIKELTNNQDEFEENF